MYGYFDIVFIVCLWRLKEHKSDALVAKLWKPKPVLETKLEFSLAKWLIYQLISYVSENLPIRLKVSLKCQPSPPPNPQGARARETSEF